MSTFIEYLENFETKVLAEGKKESSGKKTEIKNPVKTNMTGKKPKTGKVNSKVPKVKQELKNPVKTGMSGKKNKTSSARFTNPKNEIGKKTNAPGSKPAGSGKTQGKYSSPAQEMKNPVKSVKKIEKVKNAKKSITEQANNILDGVPSGINLLEGIKPKFKAQDLIKDVPKTISVADRASELL